jgi:hypothetical protein
MQALFWKAPLCGFHHFLVNQNPAAGEETALYREAMLKLLMLVLPVISSSIFLFTFTNVMAPMRQSA